jgi:predicted transcriptional regulator
MKENFFNIKRKIMLSHNQRAAFHCIKKHGSCTVKKIAFDFNSSVSGAKKYCNALFELGYVTRTKFGNSFMYSTVPNKEVKYAEFIERNYARYETLKETLKSKSKIEKQKKTGIIPTERGFIFRSGEEINGDRGRGQVCKTRGYCYSSIAINN